VKSNPRGHLKAFLIDRLRSFGLVVAIGFLLMVSLAVTAALAAFSAWLSGHSSSGPLVWSGVLVLVSLIGTTSLFALLLRRAPGHNFDPHVFAEQGRRASCSGRRTCFGPSAARMLEGR